MVLSCNCTISLSGFLLFVCLQQARQGKLIPVSAELSMKFDPPASLSLTAAGAGASSIHIQPIVRH